MSYASMAAKNAPPEEEQVQPSQALLDGHFKGETEASGVLHDGESVNVVTQDWKDHPVTDTSAHLNTHAPSPASIPHHAPGAEEPHVSEVAPVPEKKPYHGPGEHGTDPLPEGAVKVGPNKDEIERGVQKGEAKAKELGREAEQGAKDAAGKAKEVGREAKAKASELGAEAKQTARDAEAAAEREGRKLKKDAKELAGKAEDEAKRLGKEAKREFREAENVAAQYYEKAKDVLLRPGVMGGLLGVVNLGILGGLSYVAYTRKELRVDRRLVSAGVAGTLALFGAEGVLAERYINTPEGREEAERAKREGSRVWLQTKETVLRPGVAGGLVGALNVAVLGAVGYFSYKHWDMPRWDRQVVGGVAAGLGALTVAEGYLGKEYKDKELPRQKRKGNY